MKGAGLAGLEEQGCWFESQQTNHEHLQSPAEEPLSKVPGTGSKMLRGEGLIKGNCVILPSH